MGRRKGRATTDIVGQAPINFPTGSVLDFAGSTAPDGWLLCFGQAVSRTDYAALFAALGTTYGVGDGSTTFNLPDCRGRVKAGKDNMGGVTAGRLTTAGAVINGTILGATGGTQTHSLTEAQVAAHNHRLLSNTGAAADARGLGQATSRGVAGILGFAGSNAYYDRDENNTGDILIENAGSGSAHQNTQPTIILNTIIKI